MAAISEPEGYAYPFAHAPMHFRPPTVADYFYHNPSRVFGGDCRFPIANPRPSIGLPHGAGSAWLPMLISQSNSVAPLPSSDGDDSPASSVEEAGEAGPQKAAEHLTLIYKGEHFSFADVNSDTLSTILMVLQSKVKKECQETPAPTSSSQAVHAASPGKAASPTRKEAVETGNQTSAAQNSSRQASLMRFREKKRCRTFNKKIRYEVRKQVAKRMVRIKGRFAPYKQEPEAAA